MRMWPISTRVNKPENNDPAMSLRLCHTIWHYFVPNARSDTPAIAVVWLRCSLSSRRARATGARESAPRRRRFIFGECVLL